MDVGARFLFEAVGAGWRVKLGGMRWAGVAYIIDIRLSPDQ